MTDKNEFTPTIDPSNATVQAMFGAVLQQKLQSGALEQAIGKYADKLIDSCAEDVLKSYGDVGKAIKEALAKAITPHLEDLADFPTYHDFVAKRLRMAAANFYDQRLAEVLDKEISEIMSEMPQEITLSWVIDAVRQSIIGYGGGEHVDEEMTLIVENSSYGYRHIFIGKESGMDKYRCEYQLNIDNEGHIYSMKIDGDDLKTKKCVGPFYNAERKLMAAYAMKAKVVLDEGEDPYNYDLVIERYDD
ncbi:hypothetical protein C3737_16485 [Aeromonas jandaei]|uniref:hypothetical protein n=1 Tax=Aeromonas jandaei TaxID=650 RepID=UPI000CE27A20|nr:hypothetical protein [Aeromonas jandaei]PPA28975.1 hypothetical protein C3737_16485 [Aeromonas jandaei]